MIKRLNVQMTSGNIVKNLLLFALPIALGTILQTLYNMADMVVIAQSAQDGGISVGAIGATTIICGLSVNLYVGISAGANVLIAFFIGARDKKNAERTVQTAMWGSLILGLVLMTVGLLSARWLLTVTNCGEDVFETALQYLSICYLGVPAAAVYNFGAAVLRARGDSTRPLIFLAISGLFNVLMNLFFVLVFGMGVSGVAIATALANVLSAVLVVLTLAKDKNEYTHFDVRRFLVDLRKFGRILSIGLPVAATSLLYTISNLQIQGAINSFGTPTTAGNAAATTIEAYAAAIDNAFANAALSFVSQNRGAKRYDRIHKITFTTAGLSCLTGGLVALVLWIFRTPLLSLVLGPSDGSAESIANLAQSIDVGSLRMTALLTIFVLPCFYNVMNGAMRGMGYSSVPMMIAIIGVCGWRLFWMLFVYPNYQTVDNLYLCYRISWLLVAIGQFTCYLICSHLCRKRAREKEAAEA